MLKRLTIVLFSAMNALNANADTYSIEAGIHSSKQSYDDKTDIALTVIGGTYYFKPITIDSSQPFFEMDTLQRASGISLLYGSMSIESSDFSKTDLNPLEISGRFYLGDFIIGAKSSSWDGKFPVKTSPSFNYGIKSSTNGFELGYWILSNTSLTYSNENDKGTYARSSTLLPTINDLKTTTSSITSHSIAQLGGGQWLVLDLGYNLIRREQSIKEDNREYSVKFRYYPDTNYFIETGYFKNTGDRAYYRGKTISLGAGYAFTPRLTISLSNVKFAAETGDSSNNFTSLTAGYRF